MGKPIAIVGGGITGLALGWRLAEEGREVVVLEAASRPGGNIRTIRRRGCLLEQGPQWIFPVSDEVLAVIDGVGLRDQIVEAPPTARAHLVLRGGQLEPLDPSRDEAAMAGLFGGSPWDVAPEDESSSSGSPSHAFTFQDGMESLPRALAESLGDRLRLSSPVIAIQQDEPGVTVTVPGHRIQAEQVVLACPPRQAGRLVPSAAAVLGELPRAPICAVHLVWNAADIGQELPGLGWIAPPEERADVLGVLWITSSFPHYAPGHVMMRVIIGGAGDPDRVAAGDEVLTQHALDVIREVQGIEAKPRHSHVVSYRAGIPRYQPEHAARIQTLRSTFSNVHFLGWYYTGIGISHCIGAAMRWTA